jgi:hypothetical protein
VIGEGLYDVDFLIYAMCRDGKVCLIRKGECHELPLQLESKPVCMVKLDKQVAVASMDNML